VASRLVFASRNPGKLIELRQLLADVDVEVISVADLDEDIADTIEDADTFEGNAAKKAIEVSRASGLPALADDSGLAVDALDGAPGVYSARYAGEPSDDEKNNDKLIDALADVADDQRGAHFVSVIAFADCAGSLGDEVMLTRGECPGVILRERRGTGGFGYDPLFFVQDLGKTYAELGSGTKNDLSHRARAMRSMKPKLVGYFQLAKPETSG